MPPCTIEQAIAHIAEGRPVVVVDDADRENEGDLVFAAEKATSELLAFTIRHSSGVVCAALPGGRCDGLNLPPMVAGPGDAHGTAFTVTVDAKRGITTGISAADRALTLRVLAAHDSTAGDLTRPGHVFPLRARDGGVLKRRGHTEAAADLARLAGLSPVGVLCELVNDDGTMMRIAALEAFAREHDLPLLHVEDLVAYRRRTEPIVEPVAQARLPTEYGPFVAHVFRDWVDGCEHVALVRGDVRGAKDVLVRVHSECLTGDLFTSRRCDCGPQLRAAMQRVSEAGVGVVVYLRGHEGRGVGLINKLHAYCLQDEGHDTVEANLELGLPVDSRRYDVGAQILTSLGVTTLRLMSNNPAKFAALRGYPLRVVERVPLVTGVHAENLSYLATKEQKLGHWLGLAASGNAVEQQPLRSRKQGQA